MNRITIPTGYRPVLDEYDTQRAIEHIKRTFERVVHRHERHPAR